MLDGPPDSNEFCCCEICGKYGLRSEFGASGRFCGLTCVGVYTGRRNKGGEVATNGVTKVLDGKVVKRKKRKGRKLTIVKQSSMNGVGYVVTFLYIAFTVLCHCFIDLSYFSFSTYIISFAVEIVALAVYCVGDVNCRVYKVNNFVHKRKEL